MLRIILGVIAGFIIWSIIWVGSEQVLSVVFPAWWGVHQTEFEKATFNKTPFTADTTILILNVIRGAIVSVLSGFMAAVIAGESRKTTLILGILLLAFGLFVVSMTWSQIPMWYHIVFSAMLIPMTILGGKIRRA